MADEEEEVSTGIGLTTDEIFILIVAAIGFAVFLALYLDQQAVAGIGVGIVSSFAAPITAAFNGIAQAISGFFNWLSHALSNLFMLPAVKFYFFLMRWKYISTQAKGLIAGR
ncbi:MAG: hypothetical protein KIS29_09840 [Thermoplasmata archaeon]|nr:hypothetical protein [Candidatus Sysuiplasma jiujiangense]